jgi:hypothetical protein
MGHTAGRALTIALTYTLRRGRGRELHSYNAADLCSRLTTTDTHTARASTTCQPTKGMGSRSRAKRPTVHDHVPRSAGIRARLNHSKRTDARVHPHATREGESGRGASTRSGNVWQMWRAHATRQSEL